MRIAVICRHFSRASGGAESYAIALAQGLARHHEVHIFSQDSNHPVDGVIYHRVFRFSDRPRWLNQIVFACSSWFHTRRGYDIVHSHENTWQGQIQTIHVRPVRFSLLCGTTGLRLFFRWIKVLVSPRLIAYLMLERARFKCSSVHHVVATSDHLRQECEMAYPHCTGMIEVIPPGVSLPTLPLERDVARQTLGLPRAGRLVLFVANDYARKGLTTLLKAILLLPSDVVLVVVGNSGAVPKYHDYAQELNIEERVFFLGTLNDLSAAYASADCLAHPTLEDSFAMVVLEAMAYGLPVVVSGADQCGISRELTHGENALLLSDPKDEKDLAIQIGKVLDDEVMAQSLRESGLVFAQNKTWDHAVFKYEKLYLKVESL